MQQKRSTDTEAVAALIWLAFVAQEGSIPLEDDGRAFCSFTRALELLGVIQWGWFFVLLPEIIALAIYIVTLFAAIADGRGMRWYLPKKKKRNK